MYGATSSWEMHQKKGVPHVIYLVQKIDGSHCKINAAFVMGGVGLLAMSPDYFTL